MILLLLEPHFANTPLVTESMRQMNKAKDISEEMQASIQMVQNAPLLNPVTVAEKVAQCLFTDPCDTRHVIAFTRNQIEV